MLEMLRGGGGIFRELMCSKFVHYLHAGTADIPSSHKLTIRRSVKSLIGGNQSNADWRRGMNGREKR